MVNHLGPSLSDSNCYGDNCPGNINILVTFVQISNISAITDLILIKLSFFLWGGALIFVGQHFCGANFYRSKYFQTQNTSQTQNLFRAQSFLDTKFFSNIFSKLKYFGPQIFLVQKFLPKDFNRSKIFQTLNFFRIFFEPKFIFGFKYVF